MSAPLTEQELEALLHAASGLEDAASLLADVEGAEPAQRLAGLALAAVRKQLAAVGL
jgi:hypothetical protein